MSLSLQPAAMPWARTGLQRLAVMLLAFVAVAGALALLAWLASLSAPPPPPPARNPFGTALPREAAPATSGIGAYLLAWQAGFYRGLTAALKGLHASGAALPGLLGLSFAYGVFHAAGPGHGKAVIAGYIVADERSLARGVGLSFAAALLQALVAIAIVAALSLLLDATAATMNATTQAIERGSFALVALVGFWVLWRKAGRFVGLVRSDGAAPGCDHVHLPPPERLSALAGWREMAGVVVAAGSRPCAGALIVLVFALSQGLFWAGIAAALAMALGTALTTAALAALAVFFKFAALRLAGGGSERSGRAVALLEVLAAAFIAVVGLALLWGLWEAGG